MDALAILDVDDIAELDSTVVAGDLFIWFLPSPTVSGLKLMSTVPCLLLPLFRKSIRDSSVKG